MFVSRIINKTKTLNIWNRLLQCKWRKK